MTYLSVYANSIPVTRIPSNAFSSLKAQHHIAGTPMGKLKRKRHKTDENPSKHRIAGEIASTYFSITLVKAYPARGAMITAQWFKDVFCIDDISHHILTPILYITPK